MPRTVAEERRTRTFDLKTSPETFMPRTVTLASLSMGSVSRAAALRTAWELVEDAYAQKNLLIKKCDARELVKQVCAKDC